MSNSGEMKSGVSRGTDSFGLGRRGDQLREHMVTCLAALSAQRNVVPHREVVAKFHSLKGATETETCPLGRRVVRHVRPVEGDFTFEAAVKTAARVEC